MIFESKGGVAARLDRLPYTRSIRRLVLLISLGGAFEYYELFMTTYIAPGLVRSGLFKITTANFFAPEGIGFLVFSTFAGMWIGCVVFGYVADRFGRRSIFTYSLLWYSAATLLMSFQTTAVGLDLCRFIAAIGVGLEQVTIDTFLSELVPPGNRGQAFAHYQFISFWAVPAVALLGWLLVPLNPLHVDGWRCVAAIGSVGALTVWWLRRGLPESPRWLADKRRFEEAERVVADLERRVLQDLHGLPLHPPAEGQAETLTGGTFLELLKPPYRRRTIVLSIFNFAQTIGFYGFGAWVPTLLIAKGIHITTSMQYAFIIALANPIGPLMGLLVADRMERKWQLVWAAVCIGVFMLFFARQTSAVLIVIFGVLVQLANMWLSFVFHGYQAEQYPTRIRGRAVGFVYSWSRISAAFAGLMIGFFLKEGGAMAVALFIGGAMVIMVIAIGGFGARTLNRTLEEISL